MPNKPSYLLNPLTHIVVVLAMLGLLSGTVGCQKTPASPVPPVVVQPPVVTKIDSGQVSFWLTKADKSVLFSYVGSGLSFSATTAEPTVIDVDSTQTYQTMDGFGYTLTGGSAMLINQLKAADRDALLRELFATDGKNIGISYLRISIGASDLSDRVFTYNDLGTGETDLTMAKFSLVPDQTDLIPVLKQILAINPTIKILGSSWTPPVWMKTNNASKGGSLKPQYYDAYARYFVAYVQQMKAQGISIDAITVQNEPLNPDNNPSLLMQAPDQANFIKNSLGPAFKTAGIGTKIILYDHNADNPDYPISILNDPAAKQYVDGSAFHLYNGSITALDQVHRAHPTKNLYFTEQWTGVKGSFDGDLNWHIKNLIIGAPRNWSRNVLEWNLAADLNQGPHTDGGCTECLGALTLNPGNNYVARNVGYYIVAHASKFVRPGSVRIGSATVSGLPNVAFQTPANRTVLIIQNEGTAEKRFAVRYQGRLFTTSLPVGGVGTYVW